MERIPRRFASHRLGANKGSHPHPGRLTAFHDEIQRLWSEGLRNLQEHTAYAKTPILSKGDRVEIPRPA